MNYMMPARPLCPWDFPGKNTRVGCLFLLQRLFQTPRMEAISPSLTCEFFTAGPQGKPLPFPSPSYLKNDIRTLTFQTSRFNRLP